MENAKRIASLSLTNARKCLEAGNFGRAFANFLLFLKLEPARDHEVYLEFSLATREWCEELEQSNRIEDLFNCYHQASELYPNHDTVLNNIGAQLFRLGYIEEAAAYIRRSLIINPNYLAAQENLENICSHLVERWHFAMLNDKRRNVAYKFAIEKAIKSGYDTVLDIGTGTSILSLMSEASGASSVFACDSSRAMIEVAGDVLLANDMSDSVKLLHKSSTDVKIPEDVPQKVKLIVTEIFDAGLFGEHAVSTLIHAWRNLISTSPMGTIIPCGATMYVCGIECETIRQQNRVLYPVLQYLDLSQVDIHSTTGHVAEEPYTTENLAKINRGYRIVTNIAELLRVNFCNLYGVQGFNTKEDHVFLLSNSSGNTEPTKELESLNKGKDWTCNLLIKQNGHVDALAVWFDLQLDDSVTIATGADNKSCWEQAIYRVWTNFMKKESTGHETLMARKKDTLHTLFHFEQDCLRLVNCEIIKEKKNLHVQKTDPTVQQNCGCQGNQSITEKPSNPLVLPFRKRKVECSSSMTGGLPVKDKIQTDTSIPNKMDVCDSLKNVSIQSDSKVMEANDPKLSDTQDTPIAESLLLHTQNDIENQELQISNIDHTSGCGMYSQHETVNKISRDQSKNVSQCSTQEEIDHSLSFDLNTDKCSPCMEQYDNIIDGSSGSYQQSLNSDNSGDECNKVLSAYELHRHLEPNCLQTPSYEEIKDSCERNVKSDKTEKITETVIAVEMLDNVGKFPTNHFLGTSNMVMQHCCTQNQNEPIRSNPTQRHLCLVDQSDIVYVNDIHLNKQYVEALTQYRKQHSSEDLSLLYLTQRLSFLGVQACKLGFETVIMATPSEHHGTIRKVAELNDCGKDSLILVDSEAMNALETSVDVLLCDVVEPYGALGQQVFENLTFHRMASLHGNGKVLPQLVKIFGMYIESEELESLSHVTGNDKTLDFVVAEYINVFQMRNHVNIDLSTLSYTKISEVFELVSIDLNNISQSDSSNILDQSAERSANVTSSGKISALVYWFELTLADDIVVNTIDERCHWRQSAIMMKKEIYGIAGQALVSKVTLQNSCLDVQIILPQLQNGIHFSA